MKKLPNKFKNEPEIFELYDQYAHGKLERRQFLSGLTRFAVGGLTTAVLLEYLLPDYTLAEQVSFNDQDIKATYTIFPSPKGHGEGQLYTVHPAKMSKKTPVVLVVHENRGLNPYVKDVARRLAKQGFIAVAPDALHPLGGYPGNDDDGRTMQRSLDREKVLYDLKAAAVFAKDLKQSNGKLGVVGFCFGGSVSNRLAAELPDVIDAAVPYYGSPPPKELIPNIKSPLMLHFGSLDERVNARWPDYKKLLTEQKVTFEAFIYKNAKHGFHNDSTPRYDKGAAELSWSRTLGFFNKHLS